MSALIHPADLTALHSELARLKAREQELLECNTRLVLENRTAQITIAILRSPKHIDGEGLRTRRSDVAEFCALAGQEIRRLPSVPDTETLQLRLRLNAEEFFETLRSCLDFTDSEVSRWFDDAEQLVDTLTYKATPAAVDLPEFVDGQVDQAYVIEGTLLAFGVDADAVWNLVHRANMAKRGGPVVEGKLRKPKNWVAPDVAGELERQRMAVGA